MKPVITLRELPELSDEAAAKMLDLLQELATAFDNHYANQLRRYYEPDLPANLNLFDDLDEQNRQPDSRPTRQRSRPDRRIAVAS